MNIMPLPVAASTDGVPTALAWSATPTSEACLPRKREFQDPAETLFGRTEQITVPKFPRPRQNTELCDDLFCRARERPHLSNTPSRRITDERDTGFHWALRRGGWGRTPVGNPSLGACLPLLCPSMSCADSLCTYVQFLLPPAGEGAKLPREISLSTLAPHGVHRLSTIRASGFFPVSVDRVVPGLGGGPGFSRVWWWSVMKSV